MNKKGFTLMEVVIATSLLAVVSVVSLSIVANLLRSALKTQSNIDVSQASNFVYLKLKSDIQNAYKVSGGGTILRIYPIESGAAIVYEVKLCNPSANIYCVERGGVRLTDAASNNPSDPTDTTPGKSSVNTSLPAGYSSYFSIVYHPTDPTKTLAVNVVMKFTKPGATGLSIFSGDTVLDTTIVLPNRQ